MPAPPESRGRVRIKHPDPYAYPAIEPNYLATALDRETAVAGLRMTRAIAGTRAMRPFVEEELLPGPEARTDEELLEAATGHRGDHLSPGGDLRDGAGNERGGR